MDTFCPLFTWIHHLFSTTHNQPFQQIVKLGVFVVLLIGIPHIEVVALISLLDFAVNTLKNEVGFPEELGH